MKKKSLLLTLPALAALMLAGCNINTEGGKFNPSEPTPGPVEDELKVTPSSLELGVGDTETLSVKFGNEEVEGAEFESDDEEVATVDGDGKVTAVAEGECTITVKYEGKSVEVKVTVTKEGGGGGEAEHAGTLADPYTAEDAKNVALGLEETEDSKKPTATDFVYIKGTVSKYEKDFDPGYGSYSFWLDDKFLVWQIYNGESKARFVEGDIEVGDVVTICAKIMNYKGTPENTTDSYVVEVTKPGAKAILGIKSVSVKPQSVVQYSVLKASDFKVELEYEDHTTEEKVATKVEGTTNVAGNEVAVTVWYKTYSLATTIVVTPKEAVQGGAIYTFKNSGSSSLNFTGLDQEKFMAMLQVEGSEIITGYKDATNAYIGGNGGSGDTAWNLWDCLKVGKSNAQGTITLLLDGSAAFTSIKVKALGNRDDGTLTINGVTKNVTVKAEKDKLTPQELEFEIAGGITELVISSKEAKSGNYGISITSIEFVSSGTPTPPTPNPTVTGVTVSSTSETMFENDTKTLTATVTGTNNPAQTVTWSSSDPSKVSVDASTGLVTALASTGGSTVTIRATSTVDTSKYGECAVKVIGQSEGTKYNKVTSLADVVTGEYIVGYIASDNEVIAAPASPSGTSTLDGVSMIYKNGVVQDIGATSGALKLTVNGSKVVVSSLDETKYLSSSGTTGFNTTEAVAWDIAVGDNETFVLSNSTTGRTLLYRAGSTNKFGNYASSNVGGTGYNTISLFKKASGGEQTKTVSSIAITHDPDNLVYTEGQTFDPTGMVVTASYVEGGSEAVTGYTFTPNGQLTTSDTKVTISYGNKTADVSIAVNKASQETRATLPHTAEFSYSGTSGVMTKGWEGNGVAYFSSLYSFQTANQKVFATKLFDAKSGITVAVKSLCNSSEDNKATLTVNALNDDGEIVASKDIKPIHTSISKAGDLATAATSVSVDLAGEEITGVSVVAKALGGKKVGLASVVISENSTIKAELDSISATGGKSSYTAGQMFDPTDLVVTANYTNGKISKEVTNYSIDKAETALTTEDKKVVISYTEGETTKTVDYAIDVVSEGTTQKGTVDNPYTAEEAKTEALKSPMTVTGPVYVKGVVTEFVGTFNATYGNYTFYIGENKAFEAYRVKNGSEKTNFQAGDISLGDEVIIYGSLINFNNQGEISGDGKDGYVYSVTRGEVSVALSAQTSANATVQLSSNKATNGSKVTFTATANEGHEIVSVKVNGKDASTAGENNYSFIMDGPASIEVTTKEKGAAYVPSAHEYKIGDFAAGEQYAIDEEHTLDATNGVVLTCSQCHFTSDLRMYSSGEHDGVAVITCSKEISNIKVNAGNKIDTLNVYASSDGKTYSSAGTINVTATSYNDYDLDLPDGTMYIKLDVAGSNQVRIKVITLTF